MKISEQEERDLTFDEAKEFLLTIPVCKIHNRIFVLHKHGPTDKYQSMELAYCPDCLEATKNSNVLSMEARVIPHAAVERISLTFDVTENGVTVPPAPPARFYTLKNRYGTVTPETYHLAVAKAENIMRSDIFRSLMPRAGKVTIAE